jgi:hypothetical protein
MVISFQYKFLPPLLVRIQRKALAERSRDLTDLLYHRLNQNYVD